MMRRMTVFPKITKSKKKQKIQSMINKKGEMEFIWNKLKIRKIKTPSITWQTFNSWKKC